MKSSSIETVGYTVKRAQHAIRTAMDEALREIGVTTPQYAALNAIREFPGASGAELARRCFVSSQTMNTILIRLEDTGMVQRRQNGRGGRAVDSYLTDEGWDALRRCDQIAAAIEEHMTKDLSQEERQQLRDWLVRCAAALELAPPVRPSRPWEHGPNGSREES